MNSSQPLPLLALRDIAKSFGPVRALRKVSFELQAGEVHALLGENGAGKSTLIKIVTGAHSPDSGDFYLSGEIVSELSPSRARELGIACIYQQPALFGDLTIAENLALRSRSGRPWERMDWKSWRDQAQGLFDRIGAHLDPDTRVRDLSMPEQQLVEIACALLIEARIVIMDEPTASLTQKEQHLLYKVVEELRASGVGVIYISHRLEEIFELADRVTVLRDGASLGTYQVETMDETALIRLMVGREITHIYPAIESKAGEAALEVERLDCREAGIHEVSFQLRSGEVLGLAGLVGAGRTELARVLFGITPADSGTIKLAGATLVVDGPARAIQAGIAYVPEDRRQHGVILEMSIAANLSMAMLDQLFPSKWLSPRTEREFAQKQIAALGVKTDTPENPAASLSGGNQQKVALARWLATKPRVLILDEPTQGVDVGAKSEIHRIIRDLARQGVAVLMISSDLPEIIGMSDRILVMRAGRIIAELPGRSDPHEVMRFALGK